MSDDLLTNPPVVGGISAVVGAVGLWLANRILGKAAFQTAINQGFQQLTVGLQLERSALRAELMEERKNAAQERQALHAEIATLRRVVEGLKALLRDHGIDIPQGRMVELIEVEGQEVILAQEPK